MTGELDLGKLLRAISPVMRDDEFVFCTLGDASYGDYAEADPIAAFSEAEGLSLVVSKDAADRFSLPYNGTFRCITLGVHSSLEAVGLTAAVTRNLAAHGIAGNVISAYFHDHIFVPAGNADKALELLSAPGFGR